MLRATSTRLEKEQTGDNDPHDPENILKELEKQIIALNFDIKTEAKKEEMALKAHNKKLDKI